MPVIYVSVSVIFYAFLWDFAMKLLLYIILPDLAINKDTWTFIHVCFEMFSGFSPPHMRRFIELKPKKSTSWMLFVKVPSIIYKNQKCICLFALCMLNYKTHTFHDIKHGNRCREDPVTPWEWAAYPAVLEGGSGSRRDCTYQEAPTQTVICNAALQCMLLAKLETMRTLKNRWLSSLPSPPYTSDCLI